eukprot:1047252-Rhodomonas_salina.3
MHSRVVTVTAAAGQPRNLHTRRSVLPVWSNSSGRVLTLPSLRPLAVLRGQGATPDTATTSTSTTGWEFVPSGGAAPGTVGSRLGAPSAIALLVLRMLVLVLAAQARNKTTHEQPEQPATAPFHRRPLSPAKGLALTTTLRQRFPSNSAPPFAVLKEPRSTSTACGDNTDSRY